MGRLIAAFAALGMFCSAVRADGPTTQPDTPAKVERKGPLAGLPSPPGPHVEKIKALGDNQWLNLGSPVPDPTWGAGRGRSWSCKMPCATDLGGAFLNGQGVHGYIKPDGYFMDDIFFYDANAHRWICIYPGTDTRNFVDNVRKGNLTVNDDGQLVDRAGQPVPFSAIAGHSYQVHTYDSHQRKYVFFGGPGVGEEQHVRQQEWLKVGRGLLLEQGKPDRVAGTPYFFDTATGRFDRSPQLGVRPPGRATGRVVFYLPTRKALWVYGAGATVIRDTATGTWSNTGAEGPTPTGIDFAACYDSKRDRIYVGGGSYRGPWGQDEGYLFIYDVKTNTWTNPPNRGSPSRLYGSNVALMHYDAAADRVVHVVHAENERGVFVYDPESAAWSDAPLPVPAEVGRRLNCWSGFYSPELNAHFFHTAGDSRDDGVMWVYRYKAKASEKPTMDN